jgi:hypothetical protein
MRIQWIVCLCNCLFIAGSVSAQQATPAQQPGNLPAVPAALAGNPQANQAAAQPVRITATSLNGYWAGVGYLDEQKLEAKLKTLTDETQKKQLQEKANLFLSMVAVMGLQPNGQMVCEIEVTDATGKPIREAVQGTWKVVEQKENRLLVEFLEQGSDKSTTTVRKVFQFYEDGWNMASPVETSAELAEFNPLIIYERVPDAALAENVDPAAPPKIDR